VFDFILQQEVISVQDTRKKTVIYARWQRLEVVTKVATKGTPIFLHTSSSFAATAPAFI